jgi:hypothetical protein
VVLALSGTCGELGRYTRGRCFGVVPWFHEQTDVKEDTRCIEHEVDVV